MSIDWQALHYFLVVADSGSLSAAARELQVSQPTVGRHVEALEEALGFRLFRRHARGLDVTAEGQLLLEQTRQMQHSVSTIRQLAQRTRVQPAGEVRLSLPEGLCHHALVPRLRVFRERYPLVQLAIDASHQPSDLVHGEADIAVRLFRPTEGDLIARRLGTMAMGVYAGADYAARHPPISTPEQLAAHPCVAYGPRLEDLEENRWLLSHSAGACVRSDSTATRLRATEAGAGVAIQPCFIGESHPTLTRLCPEAQLPAHPIWLTYHRDAGASARTRAVADFLIETFEGF